MELKERIGQKVAEHSVTANPAASSAPASPPPGRLVRLMGADEIECRISTVTEKGVSLLLYKDARVDQRILDEAFTPFGWKRSHQLMDGNLYCTVEIWDDQKKQWIAKQDVGTAGYSEKEKSQASDSFKRACFNWGIGRELYSAPFIWIPAAGVTTQNRNGKLVCYDHFRVLSISYNEGCEIAGLEIINQKGVSVYSLRAPAPASASTTALVHTSAPVSTSTPASTVASASISATATTSTPASATKPPVSPGLTPAQMKSLQKELARTQIPLETVLGRYHLTRLQEMTPAIYRQAMNGLKKTASAPAA